MSYQSHKAISIKDQKYKKTHPCAQRKFVYIQRPIDKVIDNVTVESAGNLYTLRNMDGFFEFDPDRKLRQMYLLEGDRSR